MRRIAALALLAACADAPVVMDLAVECERHARPLAIDEASSVGVTPAQIVALVSGRRELPLRWLEDSRGLFSVGPESGLVTAVIEVSHGSGRARFVDLAPSGDLTEEACPDHVEVDVDVSLSTAGGALTERLRMPVTARGEIVARGSAWIERRDLRGSLRFTGRHARTQAFGVDVTFTPWGVGGSVTGEVIVGEGDEAVVGTGVVGLIGSGTSSRCDPGFVDMPLEASYRERRPLDLVNTLGATALQLERSVREPLPLAFSFVPAGGCLDASGGRALQVPGDLAVSAGDLELRAPASLRDEGSGLRLSAGAWAPDLDTFAREIGDTGLDLAAFDGAAWSLDVAWDPEVAGDLSISGVRVPPCQRHPEPGEACEGVTLVKVSRAAVTAGPPGG